MFHHSRAELACRKPQASFSVRRYVSLGQIQNSAQPQTSKNSTISDSLFFSHIVSMKSTLASAAPNWPMHQQNTVCQFTNVACYHWNQNVMIVNPFIHRMVVLSFAWMHVQVLFTVLHQVFCFDFPNCTAGFLSSTELAVHNWKSEVAFHRNSNDSQVPWLFIFGRFLKWGVPLYHPF